MPDSIFCRALEASIQQSYQGAGCLPPTVTVSKFTWSGLNGLRARRNAAYRLREKLAEDLRQSPEARHFVVAHSHGGNIAMYALRVPELAERISGIICMATPFLLVRLRDPNSGLFAIHAAVILTLTWLGIFLLPFWTGFPALAKAAFVIVLSPLILNLFFKTWQNNARYWVKEMEPPSLGKNQMLVAKITGDEASDVLKTAHLVFWLLNGVFEVMGLPDNFLRKKLGRAYFSRSRVYPLGVAMSLVLLLKTSPQVALYTVLGVYLASFASTGGRFLPHLPLDISAEPEPPVPRECYTFEPLFRPSGLKPTLPFSLQHSQIYEHPALFVVIADWVRSKRER